MKNGNLQGAVLMIGSLYWETEENAVNKHLGKLRKEWRDKYLDVTKATKIRVPIRYGRRSGQRFHTYTMLFSASVPKYGEAYLVPFRTPVNIQTDFSELYEQALILAKVEGINTGNPQTLSKTWGMVALSITSNAEKSQFDEVQNLKDFWKETYNGSLHANHYRISPESPIIDNDGLLTVDLELPDQLKDIDYIFSTPVITEEANYPQPHQIVDAMLQSQAQYFTYFLENINNGIRTFQDHEILTLLPDASRAPINLGIIKLSDYSTILFSLDQFQKDLQYCLGDQLFILSQKDLCIEALKSLGKQLEENLTDEQLHQYCIEFLTQFEKKFGRWDHAIYHKSYTSVDYFFYYFLNLGKPANEEYDRILNLCNQDLAKCNAQLAYYESQDSIITFNKKGRGGNLKDNIEVDFYERNQQEKKQIEKYIQKHLKSRVLFKCAGNYVITGLANDPFSWYYDRPFYSSFPNSANYFDHRLIDKVSHRLGLFKNMEGQNHAALHSSDPFEFYNILFNHTSTHEVFREIHYWINILPVIKQRSEIFNELQKLFEQKLWNGFYALSLTQLEGIYTELTAIVKPQTNYRTASLTKKVGKIRPKLESDFIFYDYCQYEVTLKRNKFLHRGLEKDVELQCYDLLIDLWYLIKQVYFYENAFFKINGIINRRNLNDFIDEEGFNSYFDLLDALPPEQIASLKENISSFEQNFLSGHLDLEYMALELSELIPQTIDHWYNTIESFWRESPQYKNIRNLNIEKLNQKKDDLIKCCRAFYVNHADISEKMVSYFTFLHRYQKYLPNIPVDANTSFLHLANKYKTEFERINHVINILAPNKRSQRYLAK